MALPSKTFGSASGKVSGPMAEIAGDDSSKSTCTSPTTEMPSRLSQGVKRGCLSKHSYANGVSSTNLTELTLPLTLFHLPPAVGLTSAWCFLFFLSGSSRGSPFKMNENSHTQAFLKLVVAMVIPNIVQ